MVSQVQCRILQTRLKLSNKFFSFAKGESIRLLFFLFFAQFFPPQFPWKGRAQFFLF